MSHALFVCSDVLQVGTSRRFKIGKIQTHLQSVSCAACQHGRQHFLISFFFGFLFSHPILHSSPLTPLLMPAKTAAKRSMLFVLPISPPFFSPIFMPANTAASRSMPFVLLISSPFSWALGPTLQESQLLSSRFMLPSIPSFLFFSFLFRFSFSLFSGAQGPTVRRSPSAAEASLLNALMRWL